MRGAVFALSLLLALVVPAQAEVTVRVTTTTAGKFDIAAPSAPLSEVLDHLARHSGMRVFYDGPEPRQLVTVSLSGRWPAEAVKELLEAQKLNYALAADAAGTGVQILIVITGSAGPLAPAPSTGASGPKRSAAPPPPNDDPAGALLRLIRPPKPESEPEESSPKPDAEPETLPQALLDLGLIPR